ncbi:uncharacterized protein TRIADDRAFT_19084, partial [Trichoplax adhaerens]
MSWIPRILPHHVSILLSTLPSEYNCLNILKKVLPHDSQYLEIQSLPVDVSQEILTDWLASNSRKINDHQMDVVRRAIQSCSLPLYLKLVFDQTVAWHSYDKISSKHLPSTIPLMIDALLDRLERMHGKVLVSRALAYITATKSGLTEPELEDLLSCDDLVLQDVYQYWLPPVRRIPPLLWTRIRNDINEYLVEREADGSQVIYWYHRQFTEVVRRRYLDNDRIKKEIHSLCADYYIGKWANVNKPFEYTPQQ